ncbi:helicase-associated domain-containing protein [Peterkaempfera griseoplana]|uniref:helicase-associated domain-containing protein n=1 Tax=Peterkaempfera griseoplana TaxID=66896 RepID=UPI0006E16A19|nr:helicase-associated domain-containing protein [Peterkaempfera griseoplana]
MQSPAALSTWLADRTPEQLAELLRERDLPGAAAYVPHVLDSLRSLAGHLLGDHSTARALGLLDTAELQLLVAVARLADLRHGPLPALADPGGEPDPAERAVPREELLQAVATDPGARRAAEERLDRLAARALVLPPHDGRLLSVPMLLHRRSAELRGLGRPVDRLLTEAFNAAEVHRVAAGLGLPAARSRDLAQRAVTTLLGDPAEVRALVAQAPPQAQDVLGRLVPGPPQLHTRCFTSQYGYYAAGRAKFLFRAAGSGDPGVDWLAERGLLVPVGTDLVELPREVGAALRPDEERPAFDPCPPPVAGLVVLGRGADGEAQTAAAAAASQAELVLRAVAAQPPALRKAGGVAVRDSRRLAKTVGIPEARARLWLDLAAGADLLGAVQDEPPKGRGRRPAPAPPGRIVPTERYDSWLSSAPAERLLPLVAAWAVTPEILSYWPDPDDTPVALVTPQDPTAVALRGALLDALAGLPEGRGLGADALPAPDSLLVRTVWQRPSVLAPVEDLEGRVAATLAEAGLLGVVAHGALTPIGHAVRALLHSGAHRYYPAVPGAGPRLDSYPAVADAVRRLRGALAELLPPPQTTARFQADLTAVVAGAASPELAELLSGCAVRESEGHAVVWRITPASVRRALDGGLDAADLLQRLSEASTGGLPLPQPLEYLVKDIARTHGRMRVVRSACCIRSDDEALVMELSKARSLARLGLRRIAPTVLVSTAEPEDTLAALRAAGYAPVLEAATGTTVVERAPAERAPAAMPPLSHAEHQGGRGPRTAAALAARLLDGGSRP